jgi:hypothetical protein
MVTDAPTDPSPPKPPPPRPPRPPPPPPPAAAQGHAGRRRERTGSRGGTMLANLANGKPWRVFPHWLRARLTPISYGPVTPVTPITLRLGIVLLTLTAAVYPFLRMAWRRPPRLSTIRRSGFSRSPNRVRSAVPSVAGDVASGAS